MYQKIIVALSLDHGIADKAIDAARKMLDDGGEIIAVHVYEQPYGSATAYVTDDARAASMQSHKEALAERVGGTADLKSEFLTGHPGRAITDFAEKVGADCVVVGSHKPELIDFLLGSTADRVVRHAPCSVHVLR